jgi:hydrogenase-4 component E
VNALLIAFLGVLIVPLFLSSWRSSLLGLSVQGFLMAWMALRFGPAEASLGHALTCADLILLRGVLGPLALYRVLRRQNAPRRNDVIPPNLLSWTLALGMVLAAFNFAELLVAEPGDQQTLVAVATLAVLLAFLILATQSDPLSQIIGVLRLENAIALLEQGSSRHQPLGVQLGQLVVVVISILLFRNYLTCLGPGSGVLDTEPAAEGPTL